MKAERSFILTFLQYAAGLRGVPPQFDPSLLDWKIIIDEILHKEVYPLFFEFGCLQRDILPPHVRVELEGPFFANSMKNLKFLGILKEILEIYEREKIDVIVLKGPVLAEKVWQNLSLRTMGDLDILVKKMDLDRAKRALLDNGYIEEFDNYREEEHHHLVPLLKPGINVEVEIHHNITWPAAGFPVENMWQRSLETRFSGVPARMPGWEDLFVHHMIGLTYQRSPRSYDRSLRILADSARLLFQHGSGFDLEDILREYEDRPFFPYLTLSLEILHELFISGSGHSEFLFSGEPVGAGAMKRKLARRIYTSNYLWNRMPAHIFPSWLMVGVFADCAENLPLRKIIGNFFRMYLGYQESPFLDRHIPKRTASGRTPTVFVSLIRFLLIPVKVVSRVLGRFVLRAVE
jgi:hypothetical protein